MKNRKRGDPRQKKDTGMLGRDHSFSGDRGLGQGAPDVAKRPISYGIFGARDKPSEVKRPQKLRRK